MRTDLFMKGVVFSAVDYTAMLVVNDPNRVLGVTNIKFLKPII